MTPDQAIATLREFRLLNLGPRLSEAIDVVVAEHERRDPPVEHWWAPGHPGAPKHNMVDAA